LAEKNACCDVDDIFTVWQHARTEAAYRERAVMRVIAGKIAAASRSTVRTDIQ